MVEKDFRQIRREFFTEKLLVKGKTSVDLSHQEDITTRFRGICRITPISHAEWLFADLTCESSRQFCDFEIIRRATVARIAGVNIPTNKRVIIALTYIHGIGPAKSAEICEKINIEDSRRVQDLSDADIANIRDAISDNHLVEGDLRRQTSMNIKRLMDMGNYRGLRHRRGLPVRGQRTHTNARTRKGPARAIAGKKK